MPKIKAKQVDTLSRKPVSYAHAAFMRHCQLKNLASYSYLYYNKNIQYFLDTEKRMENFGHWGCCNLKSILMQRITKTIV